MRFIDMNRTFSGWKYISSLLALLLAGCTNGYYRRSADREAYQVIADKTPSVRNMDGHFSITQTNHISLEAYPTVAHAANYLGPDSAREQNAHILRLEDALDLAVHHSRTYQNRKEQLYLSALALTLTRHNFVPIFSGNGSATYAVQTAQATAVGIDPITGNPTVITSDNLVETHHVSGSGMVNASWLIRDLGRVTTAFTGDILRYVTGDSRVTSSSQLSATFLRPLLRDAAFKQEQEALIQTERQVLYDMRDFAQFRKDFSVQIATAYYGVLGNRDQARNSFLNLGSSRKNAERTRAMVQEGRITTADLGRYEQQELSAESVWVNAVRNYQQSLDNFKFQLGLSVEANIVLDDHELEALTVRHPDLSVEDSIAVALAGRLDFLNFKDEFDDAQRKVELAENMLRPRLDLTAAVAVDSNPGKNGHFEFPEWDRYRWNAGLQLDPGFDRKAERNSYRGALINRERAARAVAQQEDQIKLQVRESWRTLDQAKRSFEISEIGVKLAERRVEEQDLLAEVGRAKAQDQVDAQNALIDSKNERTRALVTHTIARLQFWNNMGILYIKDNGQWEENPNEKIE